MFYTEEKYSSKESWVDVHLKNLSLLFMMFSALVSADSKAEIYKWTDENGRIHYDDKPPLTEKKELMDINESSNTIKAISESRADKRKKLLDAIDEDRQLKKENTEKEKKKKEKLTKQCHVAKDALTNYQRSRSIYDLDKDGNRVTLPASERDKIISNLQKQIEINCSK